MSSAIPLVTHSTLAAARWLQAGNLLAYPTESVWGIGCDAFDEHAVQQVLAIKQRPIDKGMIVVTDSAERIAPLLNILDSSQRQTVLDSWQPRADSLAKQAQTWLLPLPTAPKALAVAIPTWITGAHSSVAVRVIAHPQIQELCAALVSDSNPYGFMISTSCNPAGKPPALTLEQAQAYFYADNNPAIDKEMANLVGYLKGQTLGYQLPSQIRDALSGQIVR